MPLPDCSGLRTVSPKWVTQSFCRVIGIHGDFAQIVRIDQFFQRLRGLLLIQRVVVDGLRMVCRSCFNTDSRARRMVLSISNRGHADQDRE